MRLRSILNLLLHLWLLLLLLRHCGSLAILDLLDRRHIAVLGLLLVHDGLTRVELVQVADVRPAGLFLRLVHRGLLHVVLLHFCDGLLALLLNDLLLLHWLGLL